MCHNYLFLKYSFLIASVLAISFLGVFWVFFIFAPRPSRQAGIYLVPYIFTLHTKIGLMFRKQETSFKKIRSISHIFSWQRMDWEMERRCSLYLGVMTCLLRSPHLLHHCAAAVGVGGDHHIRALEWLRRADTRQAHIPHTRHLLACAW